jgi:hypothetical protein
MKPGTEEIAERGLPITADACQFCGTTWEDKCRRALGQEQKR